MAALDAQAAQIRLQSAQEAERLARERNGVLQLLQKVMQQSGGQTCSPTLKVLAAGGKVALAPAEVSLGGDWPWGARNHPLPLLSPHAQEKEKLISLERRYQLVTGGRSFPKMSSALREASGERGVRSLRLLCCRPEPLLPVGTSLVHHKLCTDTAAVLPSAFWPEPGAPGRPEPLHGLQRPSPVWEGGRERQQSWAGEQ